MIASAKPAATPSTNCFLSQLLNSLVFLRRAFDVCCEAFLEKFIPHAMALRVVGAAVELVVLRKFPVDVGAVNYLGTQLLNEVGLA